MNRVITTVFFEKKAKKFLKKFKSLGTELRDLEQRLIENPYLGTHLGADLYKIRLASKSKGKGKSGGFRVITYLIEENENENEVYLITIYDKSEEATIKTQKLIKLVNDIL